MCASLEQLVRTNWQQDSRRTSQFEVLKHDGLQTLDELRRIREVNEENEEALQRNRECYEKKLQEIGELLIKILDENHGYTSELQELWEQRELAVTASFMKLSSKLDHLADLAWKSTTEYYILDSLSDRGMTSRYEKIAEAHAQTFEWIFEDYTHHGGSHYGDTFIEWLSHGSGIFWVTGKAGSGKSTLMKYLSHHRLTSESLTHWSGTKDFVIASFYFWCGGTQFQKSQEGLLRSLLYEIFKRCPELIRAVLPQHWDPNSPSRSSSQIAWTRDELLAALKRVALQSQLTSVFCFFIDGLDEYDGNHKEIIDLIQKDFANSGNVKWCLSSRPWNVFKAAFGNGSHPSFQLENLTKKDIVLYVCDELEENEAFRNLKRREGIACAALVDEVVEKAQGVFLWVVLVVRSLTSGLQNADRIMDLQRRLRRFPSDLELYFRQMLDNIDDNYLQQTAQTFLLALQASEPLSLMTYVMVDELECDPSYALNLRIQQMSLAEIASKHSDMKLRIDSRCKDLLEVTPVSSVIDKLKPSFYDFKVDFLHRTVRDFLHLKEIYKWLLKNASCGFNVDQILCAAFLAQLKTISGESADFPREEHLSPLVDGMVHYARQIESRTNTSPTQLLESLHKVVVYHDSREESLYLLHHAPIAFPIAFSISRDLQLDVENRMDDRQGDLSLYDDEIQLLSHAIEPYGQNCYSGGVRTNYDMLRLLLSKGASPDVYGFRSNKSQYLDKFLELKGAKSVCGDVYGSWLEKAQNLELPDRSIIHMVGPRELHWVMYVLKALRCWLKDNSPFESILSETVETFLRRGVNPNWVYGKHSLWTYFTACLYLYRDNPTQDSQNCILRVIEAFHRRGVSRSQIIVHEEPKDDYVNPAQIPSIPDIESIQYKREGSISGTIDAHEIIKRFEVAGKKISPKRTGRKR